MYTNVAFKVTSHKTEHSKPVVLESVVYLVKES